MEARRPGCPSVLSLLSARPDGATTVALGLAGAMAPDRRVLIVDRAFEREEVAAQLDLQERPGLYELAYRSRLAPVSGNELETHVQWRDGVGVVAGITSPAHREEVTDHFMDALLTTATAHFDCVLVDLGRVPTALPASLVNSRLLWVVNPTPVGMWALDRAFRRLEADDVPWRTEVEIVLNQMEELRFPHLDRFIAHKYGLRVAGELPWAPGYWRGVAWRHSVRALSSPLPDGDRFRRTYGVEAATTRRAFRRLAGVVAPARARAAMSS